MFHLLVLQEKFTLQISAAKYQEFITVFESCKRAHHNCLITILSFLDLRELLKASKVNRKLYIVSGDKQLLKNFYQSANQVVTIESSQSLFRNRLRPQQLKIPLSENSDESSLADLGYTYTV